MRAIACRSQERSKTSDHTSAVNWHRSACSEKIGSLQVPAVRSNRKVWWSRGMCKTGQPHRWQAQISNRSNGQGCPYDTTKAVCPCNDLAHNHPEVAEEWDWEANGGRAPETVTAGSSFKAAWRCGICGHSWSAHVMSRTRGTGCPRCGREASCSKTRQPSISSGALLLLAEWDWEANERHGWHPDQITLGSTRQVCWVVQNECKLGLVHRWQTSPVEHIALIHGSPYPSGKAVCACNSLAVQCSEAADLWDFSSNGGLTPSHVAVQSHKVMAWTGPDGRQWQQRVKLVVNNVRRQLVSSMIEHSELSTLLTRIHGRLKQQSCMSTACSSTATTCLPCHTRSAVPASASRQQQYVMCRATAHDRCQNSGLPTSRTFVQASGVSHSTATSRRCTTVVSYARPLWAPAPGNCSCSSGSVGEPLQVAAPHLKRDLECCASLYACHAGHSNQARQNDCLLCLLMLSRRPTVLKRRCMKQHVTGARHTAGSCVVPAIWVLPQRGARLAPAAR